MGELRMSRDERPEARGYRVTDRDLELLYAIGRMKLATTHQLADIFFGDPKTASRRLRKLLALGLVSVFVLAQERPNIYALSERGREALEGGGYATAGLHLARGVQRKDLDHLLAVNDVRAVLVAEAPAARAQVTLFLADPDFRRAAGLAPPAYLPDALVALQVGGVERRLVLELDRSTERARHFAGHKVRTLVAIAGARASCLGLAWPWTVLVLARGERRIARLASAAAAEGAGSLLAFGDLDAFVEAPYATPLRAPRDALEGVAGRTLLAAEVA